MIRRCKYSRPKVDDMETCSLVKDRFWSVSKPTIQSQKRWPVPAFMIRREDLNTFPSTTCSQAAKLP